MRIRFSIIQVASVPTASAHQHSLAQDTRCLTCAALAHHHLRVVRPSTSATAPPTEARDGPAIPPGPIPRDMREPEVSEGRGPASEPRGARGKGGAPTGALGPVTKVSALVEAIRDRSAMRVSAPGFWEGVLATGSPAARGVVESLLCSESLSKHTRFPANSGSGTSP